MPKFPTKPGAVLNMLAARAAALKCFDDLPDDALIGYAELSILTNRSQDTLRQARRHGRLPIPKHGEGRKIVQFTVGNTRRYLRGELAA